MSNSNAWAWWAGRDEEWMTIGPCPTRENAISEFIDDQGPGEGDGIVMEAVMECLSLDASGILDHAYEHWSDSSDLFSHEHGDDPEPQGSKEDQKAAEVELQALLDAWFDKWRRIFPTPNMFASTRNREVIHNEDEPQALGGSEGRVS